MNGIEKMQAYIDQSDGKFGNYTMSWEELLQISTAYKGSTADCMYFAFEYGRTKGYRAAKAEQKKAAKKGAATQKADLRPYL